MTFSENIPVKIILGDGKNTTYAGTVYMLPTPDRDDHDDSHVNGTSAGIGYDYKGAGMFCVVVIAVYALSIVLLIMSLVKSKKSVLNGEIDENETNSVVQYLIKIPDLKEKTARDNFRKLKNSIIDIVERTNERKASLAGITTEILHDLHDNNNKSDKESVGISGAILGAGMSLYQPLLSSNEMIHVPDENDNRLEVIKEGESIPAITVGEMKDERKVARTHRISLPNVERKTSQPHYMSSLSSNRRASASVVSSKRVRFNDEQTNPLFRIPISNQRPNIPQVDIPDTKHIEQDGSNLQSPRGKNQEPIVQKMDVVVDIWIPQTPSNSPRLVQKVIPSYSVPYSQ